MGRVPSTCDIGVRWASIDELAWSFCAGTACSARSSARAKQPSGLFVHEHAKGERSAAVSQCENAKSPLYSTKYSDHSIEWSFSFWGGVSKVNKNGSLYERELSA